MAWPPRLWTSGLKVTSEMMQDVTPYLQAFGYSSGQGNAAGGADTILTSYSVGIPANLLNLPADTLVVEGTFAMSATSEAKTIKMQVGSGTRITLWSATTGGATTFILFRALIRRRSSSTGIITGISRVGTHLGSPTQQQIVAALGTVDWTVDQTLTIYCSGATASSIFLTDYSVQLAWSTNGVTV